MARACVRPAAKTRLSYGVAESVVWQAHDVCIADRSCRRIRSHAHQLCWLPQALKVIREKETRALSLPATGAFTLGVMLWLVYGLAIDDWPLIGSNAVTLTLMMPILVMKLRYG
jgi:MtN3 and saliva related transmembrane protein